MRILLVEDNPVDRRFVAKALEQADGFEFELTTAGCLSECFRTLEQSQFDVVLLDLWLPDSEGVATCQALIEYHPLLPVVVMTTSDDHSLANVAIRAGAQDYLIKGQFPGPAIVRVLEYAINRSAFRDELARRDQHFQEVLGHVPAIIWTTNKEAIITDAVGAGLEALGLTALQLIGRPLDQVLGETCESSDAVDFHHRAIAGEKVAYDVEWCGRSFENRISPLHDRNGNRIGCVGVAIDVTNRKAIDREFMIAHEIQQGLLPSVTPELDGFDIFGGSIPARQTCGDWFDYLQLPDGSLGLVVGDVSGKGLGPAILSATVSSFLESLAEVESNIQGILTSCNRLASQRGMNGNFAVLSLGKLARGQKTFEYGGAGERVLIVDRDGQLKHRLPASGIPIGLDIDASYEPSSQIQLESGDIVLILTDGFREAMNSNDEIFTEERIVGNVAESRHLTAKEIFERLWKATREFANERQQNDDTTGIVVKVK